MAGLLGTLVSAIWDYKVTGIWQKDEVKEAAKYSQRPGDPKVQNIYTDDDKVNADGSVTLFIIIKINSLWGKQHLLYIGP